MTENTSLFVVVGVLIGIICYQQWFFLKQIQILIDKARSNSFESYSRALTKANFVPPRETQDAQDDLGPLKEFNVQL